MMSEATFSCFSSFEDLHSPTGQTQDFFPGMSCTYICVDTVQHCWISHYKGQRSLTLCNLPLLLSTLF